MEQQKMIENYFNILMVFPEKITEEIILGI